MIPGLKVTLKVGEHLMIGETKVTVMEIRGRQCRLAIVAPKEIRVERRPTEKID